MNNATDTQNEIKHQATRLAVLKKAMANGEFQAEEQDSLQREIELTEAILVGLES